MIIENAEFRVLQGKGPAFESAFAEARHFLLSARGCHGAELLRSIDHTNTYLLQARWECLEDHTEHFPNTEAGQSLAAALGPHCDGPPRVVHYGGCPHA